MIRRYSRKLATLKDDPSYDVLTQLLLSLGYSKDPQAKTIAEAILAKNPDNEMLAGVQGTLVKNESIRTYGARLGASGCCKPENGTGRSHNLQVTVRDLPRARWQRYPHESGARVIGQFSPPDG